MTFVFAPNTSLVSAHHDLALVVGSGRWICDSYYFDVEGETQGRTLAALLAEWRRALDTLADGAVSYGPYDYSDQYTGWLRVERHGGDVVVQVGWSEELPGHGLSPRGDGQLSTDWRPRDGSAPLRMSMAACAAGIDESKRLLADR